MSQKICVVSFDHWGYDKYIVNTLNSLKHVSHHIKIDGYKHANISDRLTNTISKIFTGKNLKKRRRQEYIVEELDKIGYQDQILVINPELIDLDFHLKIKKRTSKYIAYLYDSLERCPIEHLLDGVFDEIFSFDTNNINNFGFKGITNYIYLPQNRSPQNIIYDAVYIGSYDDRFQQLLKMAKILKDKNLKYKFIIIGKPKHINPLKKLHSDYIDFDSKKIKQKDVLQLYNSSEVIVDLVREQQAGLSFRFFEALALNKKVITNNKNVINYQFYTKNNIALTNNIPVDFFSKHYKPIPDEIYHKYTLKNWVTTVFNLETN